MRRECLLQITFAFVGFQFVCINNNEAIDAVVEGRIDVEIKKNDTAGFAEFGILFVERGDGRAKIG